jgi:hypothetical protein
VTLLHLIPTFQENVAHRLWSAATLALVGVGLVDGVEVGTKADLACAYLCDHRADRSVRANMCVKCRSSWTYAESEELSAMRRLFPG